MAKQDYIFRYLTIIKKLRRSKQASFEEIRDYLHNESEFQDRPFSISNRTFLRDLNEIRDLFKIDIQYDHLAKAYHIADDQQTDLNNRMLESIDTINSLKMANDVAQYMFFERRKAAGTHHFHGLLHAIKNRIVLNLIHRKYEYDDPTTRLVEPYALKESKGRWYLFAKDLKDKKLKTFGLDRILDFENTPQRFDYPKNLDVNAIFQHCFGVINLEDGKPEDVVLKFDPEQGKYINSYPLHESQTILVDDENELRVKLHICITHDLIMEILSFGETVEVVKPRSLSKKICTISDKVSKLYQK
ncbi:MAG: WYL domain-containing protein [Bacteroidetes bacterium]|nr:WYL domain-containing protein [Bacteroidota bacterium]